jgi:hypothetical protein
MRNKSILLFVINMTIAMSYSCDRKVTKNVEPNLHQNEENKLGNMDSSVWQGVLLLRSDSADFNDHTFSILNEDKTIFTTIKSESGEEPSSSELKNNIIAYYPDYYIIHFEAIKIINSSFYEVKIGNKLKLLPVGKYMEFLTWPEYILRFFCTVKEDNPLREEPFESAKELANLNYEELNFRCLDISGDWVKVRCNIDCEGCPPKNKEIEGWVRWKKDGIIILKQYYTC